ncbi:hypothetical protein DDV98_25630 [Streptomyces sp. IB2014 011-12]|nr:hypothetical protein DDV98_25630 [Streptomyces sp. IB2014 011-12]
MNSLVNLMKYVPLARDLLHDMAGNLLMLSFPWTTSMPYDTSLVDWPGAPRSSPESEGLGAEMNSAFLRWPEHAATDM